MATIQDPSLLSKTSAHAATFAEARTMVGISGRAKHVYIESHTTFGDGGGGIFDVKPVGSYVDNNGTVIVIGSFALVRRVKDPNIVHLDWFGPDKSGLTDCSVATNAAFLAADHVVFGDDGYYLFTTPIFVAKNNVTVLFGKAHIINGGIQYIFHFGNYGGTYGTTWRFSGLKICGGIFEQQDITTTSDTNYIIIRATKDFEVSGCLLKNVGAAGLQVQVGSRDGDIHNVNVEWSTNFADCIGIVLSGTNAVDYGGGVYVDWETLERNSVPLPVYGVENVSVHHCKLKFDNGYGIYAMNTRNCSATNNEIHLGAGGKRGIAIHNYSPGFKASYNTIQATSTATGIIVTQCATGVEITENIFKGSFGSYRTIAISTLAEAIISNNIFEDNTRYPIYVCTNGFAVIRNNLFSRATHTEGDCAVWVTAVDMTQGYNPIVGRLAGIMSKSGIIFEGNTLRNLSIGVLCETHHSADNGNQPGVGIVTCERNTFVGMDSSTVREYPMIVRAGDGYNTTSFRYGQNTILPALASSKNMVLVEAGTAYHQELADSHTAVFDVNIPVSGGTIAISKVAGENFALSVVRDLDDLVLSPLTQNGLSGYWGPQVPMVSAVRDNGGSESVYQSSIIKSGNDYHVKLFGTNGTQIPLSISAARVNVSLGPISMGWSQYTYDRYLIELADAVGGLANITKLCLAEDVTGSVGDNIASIPARIGTALTRVSAGSAVVAERYGYRCIRFNNVTDITAYNSTQTYGQVGRTFITQYSGALPSDSRKFLAYDPTSNGSIYIPSAGINYWSSVDISLVHTDWETSNIILDTTKAHTITKGASADTNTLTSVGGYVSGSAVDNYQGDIWCLLITANQLTLTQHQRVHAVNRRYYKFLGVFP